MTVTNGLTSPFLTDIQIDRLQAPADIQADEINFFTILPADIGDE